MVTPRVCLDETGAHVGGKLKWVRGTAHHRGMIGHVVERHDDAIVICLGQHIAEDQSP